MYDKDVNTLKYPPNFRSKLIAEIGLTHDGSLGNAICLSNEAVLNGADIVKFQVHYPNEESSIIEKFRKNFSYQDKSRWDYWERTSFSASQWKKVKNEVENSGGIFSASVFSSNALKMMLDLDTKIIKLGSGDLLNEELLEELILFNGTLIMSTGMATLQEVSSAVDWMKSAKCDNNSAILQCYSQYPTPLEKIGLNIMLEIMNKFQIKSGLSDHSIGISASMAAATLGASYIEKHVVYSNSMFGPDSSSSIVFKDLMRLREYIDDFQKLVIPLDKDKEIQNLQEMRINFGRSLSFKKSLKEGEIASQEDFCLRKPAGGFTWRDRIKFLGIPLKKDFTHGDLIRMEHFYE